MGRIWAGKYSNLTGNTREKTDVHHHNQKAGVPLSARAIRAYLRREEAAAVVPAAIAVHVLERVDSTNAWLGAQPHTHAVVCVAEHQSAGRGRLGRSWYATPYRDLTLSLGWDFRLSAPALSGLSLAVAVGVCRALQAHGVVGVGVKWPNDLVVAEAVAEAVTEGGGFAKLGGILIESSRRRELCRVIIGIGLNLHLQPPADAAAIGVWTDLKRMGYAPTDRNQLAARVIVEVMRVCADFAARGFAPFRAPWLALHGQGDGKGLAGKRVEVGGVSGTLIDIDERGGLRIAADDGTQHTLHGGEAHIGAEQR